MRRQVFVSQLCRRARLLNDGFQVFSALALTSFTFCSMRYYHVRLAEWKLSNLRCVFHRASPKFMNVSAASVCSLLFFSCLQSMIFDVIARHGTMDFLNDYEENTESPSGNSLRGHSQNNITGEEQTQQHLTISAGPGPAQLHERDVADKSAHSGGLTALLPFNFVLCLQNLTAGFLAALMTGHDSNDNEKQDAESRGRPTLAVSGRASSAASALVYIGNVEPNVKEQEPKHGWKQGSSSDLFQPSRRLITGLGGSSTRLSDLRRRSSVQSIQSKRKYSILSELAGKGSQQFGSSITSSTWTRKLICTSATVPEAKFPVHVMSVQPKVSNEHFDINAPCLSLFSYLNCMTLL